MQRQVFNFRLVSPGEIGQSLLFIVRLSNTEFFHFPFDRERKRQLSKVIRHVKMYKILRICKSA